MDTLLPSVALTSYGGRAAGQADYTVFLATLLSKDKAIVLLISQKDYEHFNQVPVENAWLGGWGIGGKGIYDF